MITDMLRTSLGMLINQLVYHCRAAPRENGPRRQELLEQHAQEEVPRGERHRRPPQAPPGREHFVRLRDAGPCTGRLQRGEHHDRIVEPCWRGQARLDRLAVGASASAITTGRRWWQCAERRADRGGSDQWAGDD